MRVIRVYSHAVQCVPTSRPYMKPLTVNKKRIKLTRDNHCPSYGEPVVQSWSELLAQDLTEEPDLSDGENQHSTPTVQEQANSPSPSVTNVYPGRPTNYRFKYRAPVEDENGRWVKTPPPRHTRRAGLRPRPRQREWRDFHLG